MAKVSFDGSTKLITILPGISEIDVGIDLYSEWKRWVMDGEGAQWEAAFRTTGGDPTNLAGTQFSPRYYFLINGWKILVDNGLIVNFQLNLYTDNPDGVIYTTANNSGVNARLSDSPVVKNEYEQKLEYNNIIYINSHATTTGSVYPFGTSAVPVNNPIDAFILGEFYDINRFNLTGEITMPIDGDNFYVEGGTGEAIVHLTGTTLTNVDAKDITLDGDFGVLSSNIFLDNCILEDNIQNVSGFLKECGFKGIINLKENTTDITFLNCFSLVPGTFSPTLNAGLDDTASLGLNMRGYMGGLLVKNFNSPTKIATLEFASGKCRADSTNTNGVISIRGIPFSAFTNESNGTTIDTTSLLASQLTIDEALQKIEYNSAVTIDMVNGVSGTSYPVGTHINPVNNLTDALVIADIYKIKHLHLHSSLVVDVDLEGFTISGVNGGEVLQVMGVNLSGCYINNMYLGGNLAGVGQLRVENTAILPDTIGLSGAFKSCGILGDIQIKQTEPSAFIDCFTMKLSSTYPDPKIKFGADDDTTTIFNVNFSGFSGGVILANSKNALSFIDFNSRGGHIVIDNSNTAGNFRITGIADNAVVNESNLEIDVDTLAASAVQLNEVLERIDYGDRVYINEDSGFAGTNYPIGTSSYPVNNMADAHAISLQRFIFEFELQSDLTIDVDLRKALKFRGQAGTETVTFTGTATPECTFENLRVEGDLGSQVDLTRFENCRVYNITNFHGAIYNSVIMDNIHFASGSPLNFIVNSVFINSQSLNPNQVTPIVYAGDPLDDSAMAINLIEVWGATQIENLDNATKSLDYKTAAGYLIIGESCDNSFVFAQGVTLNNVVNNGGPGMFLNTEEWNHTIDERSITALRDKIAKKYNGTVELGSLDHAIDRIDKNTQT